MSNTTSSGDLGERLRGSGRCDHDGKGSAEQDEGHGGDEGHGDKEQEAGANEG
jgi:hypothetical protein